jgi:exonuclease, DNA polymerase III, epsilon subunit family
MSRFTFFDVETPNRNNDRISSMGIVVVEDGITIFEANILVNPEVRFDPFNIGLTKITPAMVRDEPTLKEIWASVRTYFEESIIVAHNATFDLGVLTMTLAHYGIEIPCFHYICTVVLARRFLKYRKNSLDYLCATLGVLLERHHEALSDAKGCQGIFYHIVEHHGYNDSFVSEFYRPHMRGKSVLISNEHTDTNRNSYSNSYYKLKSNLTNSQIETPVQLKTTTDHFEIKGKSFCLTGDFKYGEKTDVELFILAHGGRVVTQVTRQLDFVLVGTYGSPLWAYGNYGTKVKKALDYKMAGQNLHVILEVDFFKKFE